MARPAPQSDSTVVAPPALPTLGRYSLLTKLATGGMAEIFLARQQGSMGFEKLVVIKRILDSYAEDPDFVSMFLDEARIASQLNHPNIVQIYDLGEEEGTYFIAMEYLAGESLAMVARTAIQRGEPLAIAHAVKLVSLSAEALAYAHQKTDAHGEPLNIVHRDVSPHNLFVTYEGNLKVLDFGIAKAANRATRTVGNQVKGTMAYMSPEQVQGRDVDARADVFALGVVLFEAVTRSRLFQRDEPGAVYGAVVGPEPIPLASERNPEVDADLDAIIAQALERDRDARFQSAGELAAALEGWLRQGGAPTTAELGTLMRSLFEERMNRRAQLMERAQRGEEVSSITISRRGEISASMPGASTVGPAPVPPRSLSGAAIALISSGLVLVIGLLAAVLLRSPPPPAPVVVEVHAQPVTPPVAPKETKVSIDSDPTGAVVSIDGVEKGTAPLSLTGIALGTHEVSAHRPAQADVTRPLVLDSAGQSVELLLRFPPAPAAPVAPTPSPTEPVEHRPAPSPKEPVEHHPVASTKEKPAAPTAPPKMGRLTLVTTPWTSVYEGTTSLGDTPLAAVPLPAGTHRLRLVNPDQNVKQVVEVVINPDKTTITTLHF